MQIYIVEEWIGCIFRRRNNIGLFDTLFVLFIAIYTSIFIFLDSISQFEKLSMTNYVQNRHLREPSPHY